MTLALIRALLGLVDNLIGWARESKLIDAGQDKAIVEMYRQSHEKHSRAVAARDALERDLRANPGRVRDPDPDSRT